VNRVVIFGATSAIAEATARRFAQAGDVLFLAGRSRSRLDAIADDLRVRGASSVDVGAFDALDADSGQLVSSAAGTLGGIDIALIAHGILPDQQEAKTDLELVRRSLEINTVSALCLMTCLAEYFEKEGCGTLAVISSVAGDRGRASNYLYGAAKAAVSHFAEGLRCRFAGTGVRVVNIKPGFVDTPMTAGFAKGALWASPDAVAGKIHEAILAGKGVAYVPWFWRWIMLVIRLIPDWLFRRLPL